jgi:hypothetical protein
MRVLGWRESRFNLAQDSISTYYTTKKLKKVIVHIHLEIKHGRKCCSMHNNKYVICLGGNQISQAKDFNHIAESPCFATGLENITVYVTYVNIKCTLILSPTPIKHVTLVFPYLTSTSTYRLFSSVPTECIPCSIMWESHQSTLSMTRLSMVGNVIVPCHSTSKQS